MASLDSSLRTKPDLAMVDGDHRKEWRERQPIRIPSPEPTSMASIARANDHHVVTARNGELRELREYSHEYTRKREDIVTTYPGGKNGAGVYQTIINLMPPHDGYIEPFLGGGAVLRLKRPARWSIGIDSDAAALEALAAFAAIIPGLQLIQADALEWLASTRFSADTLIYCDPPYLLSTRRQHRPIYRCELCDDQHRELLRVIKSLSCMVMISGYYSDLYASELSNWRSVQFTTRTRGGSTAIEWLWMNYPAPLELHDYKFLGTNFRERERIQRKRKRWFARLQGMQELERYAILSALEELRSGTGTPGDTEARPGERVGNGDGIPSPDLALRSIPPILAMAAGNARNNDAAGEVLTFAREHRSNR